MCIIIFKHSVNHNNIPNPIPILTIVKWTANVQELSYLDKIHKNTNIAATTKNRELCIIIRCLPNVPTTPA